MKKIEIGHGSGGRLTRDLIEKLFLKYLDSSELKPLEDAAYISFENPHIAITTDSYVVRPLFFPGGDIGKLAVCGAVNDLAVSGAIPKYLSLSFIIEEGFLISHLKDVLKSIKMTSEAAGVKIVTGDTKVVERGKCDGLYINTTAVGEIVKSLVLDNIADGDAVIVTGTLGDHGTAVAIARNEFDIDASVESDCAPLNSLLTPLFDINGLKWMRDPTRGGAATVLVEVADKTHLGVEIYEENIPVRDDVKFISDMLGYDPLYLANEGKAIIITSQETTDEVLNKLRQHTLGKDAALIGRIMANHKGVRLRTKIGGERVLDMLEDDMLPRIC
ncbi:MAG: hydrogenase expression/formation protein HypE [Thermodesulfovibrionia bacterium]|nr:hydrogenase expression/formation protein HypE [Thermodesulfovibrionia bacterium]